MTDIEDALTRVFNRHDRPDDQSDCTCGHYYDIDADGDPRLWAGLHAAHLAGVVASLIEAEWAAVWDKGFTRGFYDVLAGSDRDASESVAENPYRSATYTTTEGNES